LVLRTISRPVQVPAPVEPSPKRGGIRRREPGPVIRTEELEIYGELANVVTEIKKTYSPAVIRRASAGEVSFGRLPSGILAVDVCLAGGLMLSRGSMIYGHKSAGKSTLAARFVAAAQRLYPDKFAVYIDIEGTLDKPWMARNGVDLERLLIIEPETGESAVDMADAVLRANETSIAVSDSIAMLTPMKEIQASSEDSLPGIHARLVGNYLRRVNASMLTERHRNHYPVVLHINQFRMKIGVMFGDPRTLPGGMALEFSTTQQIEVSNKEHTNKEKEKDGTRNIKMETDNKDSQTKVVWNEHHIKITKDKSGGRYKEGGFKLIRDESVGLPVGYIDQSKTIINLGLQSGILTGAPTSFQLADGDIWNGKFRGQPDFVKFLVEDIERERKIVAQIVESYRQKWGVT
jgi:recombination protein RecA